MGQVSVTTEGATRRVTMSQVYVTGLACAMASVRQMSQVWHVMRQMSQVWHVSWRLCVRCHGVRASDVMSRNVKTAAVKDAVIVGIEVDRNKMVKEKVGLQLHSVHTGPSTGQRN